MNPSGEAERTDGLRIKMVCDLRPAHQADAQTIGPPPYNSNGRVGRIELVDHPEEVRGKDLRWLHLDSGERLFIQRCEELGAIASRSVPAIIIPGRSSETRLP
jgi:hypothetical protein